MANSIAFSVAYEKYKNAGGLVSSKGIYIESEGKKYNIIMDYKTGEYKVIDLDEFKEIECDCYRIIKMIENAIVNMPVSQLKYGYVPPKIPFYSDTLEFEENQITRGNPFELSEPIPFRRGELSPLPDWKYLLNTEPKDILKELNDKFVTYQQYNIYIDVPSGTIFVGSWDDAPQSGLIGEKRTCILDDAQAKEVLKKLLEDAESVGKLSPEQLNIINNFINGKGNENIK